MTRAPSQGSGKAVLIVGLLALITLGAGAYVLIYSMRDDPKPKRERVVIPSAPSPEIQPSAGATAKAKAPEGVAAQPPKPRDPNVFDPNGEYRTVVAETHEPVPEGTWQTFEKLMGRRFQNNERQRVEKLMNGWNDDRGTYQRALDEGRWDPAEYSRRMQQLHDGMKKRMSEMLQVDPADTDRMLLLFE